MAGQFGGERRIANIRKLIDVSRGFERDGNYGLEEFVRYVETLSEAEDREGEAALGREDADVVQLLTVHRAKGLEWPVVVVPDAARDLHASHGPVVQSTDFGVCPRHEDDDAGRFAVAELIRSAELQRDLAEHRRLLYVAATRARDYLIVSAAVDPEDSRSLPRDSWIAWLLQTAGQSADSLESDTICGDGWSVQISVREPEPLPPIGGRSQTLAEVHEGRVRAGEPLEIVDVSQDLRSRIEAIRPSTEALQRVSVTDLATYSRCPREFWFKHIADLPARNDSAGLGQLEGGANAFDVGTFAHLVLEMVGRDGAGAVDDAIQAAQRAPDVRGLLSSEQIRDVCQWLQMYLDGETYDRIVKDARRLRSEVGMVCSIGGVHVQGKIDALAEFDDGVVHLIDYKTGPGSGRDDEYRFQVGLYCEGLRASLGRYPDTARLVYLQSGQEKQFELPAVAEDAVAAAQGLIAGIRSEDFDRGSSHYCDRCSYSWACKHS
jgi:ATP-dependent helicase/nuclease subunit A